MIPKLICVGSLIRRLGALSLAVLSLGPLSAAWAEDTQLGSHAGVAMINGYPIVSAQDLTAQSVAGPVRWIRWWDGYEWRFNSDWESLSNSFRNLTGSTIGDTGGGSVATPEGGDSAPSNFESSSVTEGCWVMVDEDWQPSDETVVVDGVSFSAPLEPIRTTPFNRSLGGFEEDDQTGTGGTPGAGGGGDTVTVRINVDYAALCPGASLTPTLPAYYEALRLATRLFLGQDGRYAFDNNTVIEKRAVLELPTIPAAQGDAPLSSGRIAIAPHSTEHGYHLTYRDGRWVDYNSAGRVVAYSDKNGNVHWMQRDSSGKLVGVVENNGRVLLSMAYTGALVTRVRDYPVGSISGDAAFRTVQYAYDEFNRLITVTDVRGKVTRYEYDTRHRLVKIIDPEDRTEQLDYQDTGRVVKTHTAADGGTTTYSFEYDEANKQFYSDIAGPLTTGGQRKTQYTYNRVGRLKRRVVNGKTELEVRYDPATSTEIRTNQRGYSTRISKDEFGQITSVLLPDGSHAKFRYDPVKLTLVESTDPIGVKSAYEYDANGNLIRQIDGLGLPEERITEYVINAKGLPEQIIRRGRNETNGAVTPDAVWQVLYDEVGNVRQVTDPEGKVRHYVFDRRGNLLKAVDPLGQTSEYTYDAADNLLTETDPLDHTTTYTYDDSGKPVSITDPRGKTVTWGYDAAGRLASEKDPYLAEYKTEYSLYGRITQVTDASGQSLRMDYDALQRLTKVTDGRDQTYQFSYLEADGSDRNLTQPRSLQFPTFTRQLRYSARDWLTLKSDQAGTDIRTESYGTDARGQRKSLVDANGKTSAYEYNAFGEVTQARNPMEHTVGLLRDARGNVIQITDPNGHATTFAYDRRDLLLSTTDPLGNSTRYTYDDNGRLTDILQANGQKVHYSYDDDSRVHEYKEYAASGDLVKTTTFTYDDADNLTGWNDGSHSGFRSYDDAGRLLSESVTSGTATLGYSYTYHSNGQIATYTGPDGVTVSYGYDPLGQLQTVTIPGEGVISVTEWQWTVPKKRLLPGGSEQRREYNGFQELTRLKTINPSQVSVYELQNQYGKLAELKQTTRDGASFDYSYDDALRLTGVDASASGRDETFQLDAASNRIQYSGTGSETWVYDDANQLTSNGPVSYQYDAAGNLITKADSRLDEPRKTTHYIYDAFNRLIEVTDGNNATLATYAYDPFNRRIRKTASGATTWYVQSDQGLLAEADASGSVKVSYGWSPDTPYGTDPLYARSPGAESGTHRYLYYQNDQLGTPQRITDKSGVIVWAADYDAFGYAVIQTAAGDLVVSNLRFPGQYFDEETGLHYNFNRYYASEAGRYISRDPLGFEGGINLYAYAGSNPIKFIDSNGLWPTCVTHTLSSQKRISNDKVTTIQSRVTKWEFGMPRGEVGPNIEHGVRIPRSPLDLDFAIDVNEVEYTTYLTKLFRVLTLIEELKTFCEETRTEECGNTKTYRYTYDQTRKTELRRDLIDQYLSEEMRVLRRVGTLATP